MYSLACTSNAIEQKDWMTNNHPKIKDKQRAGYIIIDAKKTKTFRSSCPTSKVPAGNTAMLILRPTTPIFGSKKS